MMSVSQTADRYLKRPLDDAEPVVRHAVRDTERVYRPTTSAAKISGYSRVGPALERSRLGRGR